MTSSKQRSGFVLPIVVLLLTAMSLVWAGGFYSTDGDRELQQMKRIEAELLFWHKALVAFAFQHERGLSNFHELRQFYDLEQPEFRLDNGQSVIFSNWPTWQNILELNIDNLPDQVVANYLQSYPRGVRSNRGSGLIFPAVAIEQWAFTSTLVPRRPQNSNYMAVDLDLGSHTIAAINAVYTSELNVAESSFSEASQINDGMVTSARIAHLDFADATLAGVDITTLVDQLLQLEAQLGPCLAADGPCHN